MLPLGARYEGWDNVTYRLGEALAIRLPRRALGASLTPREHLWLPRLAQAWSFPAPAPVRIGAPEGGYPYAWSVVPWLEGQEASTAPLSSRGANDLGRALAELHAPAPPDAPRNPFRSDPLEQRAERFDDRIERVLARGVPLADDLAREQFREGALQRRSLETWTHLDLHGANVLTRGGRLAGILDWGDFGVGDPATDLGQAWCLVGTSRLKQLLQGYRGALMRLDEPAMLRIRAEALGYAMTLASLEEEPYGSAGVRALEGLGVVAG